MDIGDPNTMALFLSHHTAARSIFVLFTIFYPLNIAIVCFPIHCVIRFLYIQTFETFVQGEINKILQISGIEERHLVVRFNNALATRSGFERVWKSGLHKISSEIAKFLQKLLKLLPHTFETPMHPWNQKPQNSHHRNPLKNGSFSENVVKECERVLFQPLHFATLADLVALIVFEILSFSWAQFVKYKFI